MNHIGLQTIARPRPGVIEHFWFENEHVGLPLTRFHRIVLPFEPFDSGLDYVHQPESTELVVDWIRLEVADPYDLDGVVLSSAVNEGMESSLYLGGAHNPVDIERLELRRQLGSSYEVLVMAFVDFEYEGVARCERFVIKTHAAHRGEGWQT